ncbi:MAG: FAD-dependent thymidylate synthase [Thermoplasmata archaeon]|nr:FAD-dependent thymidylate synthase [Thermoplasmata archaeon]
MSSEMKVVLLAHTPHPEEVCCAAAKLTHEPEDRDFMEMFSSLETEDGRRHMEKVLGYVLKKQHESVVEHASFTFYIEGVSRALTHQLVRHRIASYSQQSQRYVRLDNFRYVTPPGLEDDARYREVMESLARDYSRLLSMVPPEDARYVLPNACTTKIVVTMNARELRHFFRLRLDKTAQWEIRSLARKMYDLCMEKAPLLFRDLEVEMEGEETSRRGDGSGRT